MKRYTVTFLFSPDKIHQAKIVDSQEPVKEDRMMQESREWAEQFKTGEWFENIRTEAMYEGRKSERNRTLDEVRSILISELDKLRKG
jgi:hypothetical protein